jgi:hypothetical protein
MKFANKCYEILQQRGVFVDNGPVLGGQLSFHHSNRCDRGPAASSIVGRLLANDLADARPLRPGGRQKPANFYPSSHVELRFDRLLKELDIRVEVTVQRCEFLGSLALCVATSAG